MSAARLDLLEKLAVLAIRALELLNKHPFPADLCAIRRTVKDDFGGDEEAAMAEKDVWVSQTILDEEMEAYLNAKTNSQVVAKTLRDAMEGKMDILGPDPDAPVQLKDLTAHLKEVRANQLP